MIVQIVFDSKIDEAMSFLHHAAFTVQMWGSYVV